MKMSSFKHGLKKVQVFNFFNQVRVELIQSMLNTTGFVVL